MISFEQDGWLRDTNEQDTRWYATLSDGTEAIQDDERPGLKITSAWERLGIYCKEKGLWITSMKIQFRSHIEHVGSDVDGFFFCKSIIGGISAKNANCYLTGTLSDGILKVEQWKIPELVKTPFLDDQQVQKRDPETAGICLIRKPV